MKMEQKEKIWLINHLGAASENLYCIVGNTFPIKDTLKEKGCKYNSILKWFSTQPIEVPNCTIVPVPTAKIYEWNNQMRCMELKQNAAECFNAAMKAALPPSKSEWQGEIGERLRNINTKLMSARSFLSTYGTCYVYTFEDEKENSYVWYTSSFKGYLIDHCYCLTGTVKNHTEDCNKKQTILSRCRVSEI